MSAEDDPSSWVEAAEEGAEAASGSSSGSAASSAASGAASSAADAAKDMAMPDLGSVGKALMVNDGGIGVESAAERFGCGKGPAHMIHGASMIAEELFGVSGVPAIGHVAYGAIRSAVGRGDSG